MWRRTLAITVKSSSFLGLGLVLLVIPLLLSSCSPQHIKNLESIKGGGYVPNPNPDPQLKANAEEVLKKCLSCHGESGANQKFIKNSADVGMDALAKNETYVRIGQGASSRLYLRSNDGSMPPGNPLSSNEADKIKAWIDDLGVFEGGGEETNPAPTFAKIEDTILKPKCYTCHDNPNHQFPFGNYNDILYGFVIPFDLDSPLYRVVLDGSMPKNGPPLSNEEVEIIKLWILDGAPDN